MLGRIPGYDSHSGLFLSYADSSFYGLAAVAELSDSAYRFGYPSNHFLFSYRLLASTIPQP